MFPFSFVHFAKAAVGGFGVRLVPAKTKDFGIRVTDSVILSRKQKRRDNFFFRNLVHNRGHDSAKSV